MANGGGVVLLLGADDATEMQFDLGMTLVVPNRESSLAVYSVILTYSRASVCFELSHHFF